MSCAHFEILLPEGIWARAGGRKGACSALKSAAEHRITVHVTRPFLPWLARQSFCDLDDNDSNAAATVSMQRQ